MINKSIVYYINLIYKNSDIKFIKIPYLYKVDFFNIFYCIILYVI